MFNLDLIWTRNPFYFCVYECSACILCNTCATVALEARKSGAIMWCWESNLAPLGKQAMLLTRHLSSPLSKCNKRNSKILFHFFYPYFLRQVSMTLKRTDCEAPQHCSYRGYIKSHPLAFILLWSLESELRFSCLCSRHYSHLSHLITIV